MHWDGFSASKLQGSGTGLSSLPVNYIGRHWDGFSSNKLHRQAPLGWFLSQKLHRQELWCFLCHQVIHRQALGLCIYDADTPSKQLRACQQLYVYRHGVGWLRHRLLNAGYHMRYAMPIWPLFRMAQFSEVFLVVAHKTWSHSKVSCLLPILKYSPSIYNYAF